MSFVAFVLVAVSVWVVFSSLILSLCRYLFHVRRRRIVSRNYWQLDLRLWCQPLLLIQLCVSLALHLELFPRRSLSLSFVALSGSSLLMQIGVVET